jgi:hypothetical protein
LDDVDVGAWNDLLVVQADVVFAEDATAVGHKQTLSGDFKSLADTNFEFACCRGAGHGELAGRAHLHKDGEVAVLVFQPLRQVDKVQN